MRWCKHFPFLHWGLLLCLLFSVTANAQNTIVEGRVTDAKTGEGIAFAAVAFVGTTMGTTTDFNGYYIINANKPVDSLRCVFVGYNPLTLKVQRNKKTNPKFCIRAYGLQYWGGGDTPRREPGRDFA